MAFRIFSQLTTFFDQQGELLAGGELRFFLAGTTTAADVYGNESLTVNNGVSVQLDSSGRPDVDVWGDDIAYFVELFNAAGVKQGEMDDMQSQGGAGSSLPAMQSGKFLTNNGAVLSWADVRQVPDPTGQGGKILGNDGENILWQSPPDDPEPPAEPDVDVGTKKFTAGKSSDENKYFVQCGESSASASGGRTTNASITFPEAFDVIWHVSVTQKHNGVTANAAVPAQSVTADSESGFSVRFSVEENSTWAGWDITAPVPFSWMAVGTKKVPVAP